MSNLNPSNSSVKPNWRAMIFAAIGGGGGTALGLLASYFAGFETFLPKLLTVCACIVIGIVLAQVAARK